MKKMNKLFLFGITFFAFVLASCKIGLGEALDLTGPDVEIISPTMRQSVRENFTVIGTAYDNNDVKKLTVTVDDNEWKNEDGVWTFKAKGSSSYVPYADATWEVDADKKVKWQIRNVNITSGRKLLTVVAVDGEGNTSANSQKVITIFFDNNPPEVTITTPNIKYKDFAGERGIKAEFSAITDYKQLQIVNNVLTGSFKISGVTKDDSTVNYVRLFVKKVDENSGEAVASIEKNLVLADSGQTFVDPISKDTLRSWEVEITNGDLVKLGIGNDKQYLQISTQASDNAGNADVGIDVHGYVILWKDADHPWLTVNLSSDESTPTNVYSGASCQGTAFDNVQVNEVLLTIEEKDGTSWKPYKDYTNKKISDEVDAEDVAQTLNFQFNYPSEVAVYRITLKAVDTNGNESESAVRYVDVLDMTFPSIKIEPITDPFGDAAGNFKIKVTALDETGVKSIKYRICTESNDKTIYSDKTNANWGDNTKVNVTSNPTQTGTDDTGGFLRLKYDVEYSLNLFNDLGIGMNAKKLEQTTFIFLVEDEQGNRSLTKFVLPADVNPPKVTLDKVGIYDADQKEISAFLSDFELSGTWSDDSFNAWKSMDSNKAPKLTVKLLGKELTGVKMNDNGTWSVTVPLSNVMQYGSVVGAIDIEVSITDIGGATTTVQKGYQIDTNAPRLEYTSCNLSSGTYGAGQSGTITLHFNRKVKVDGTLSLTLSSGQTVSCANNNAKELNFNFTTETGKDTNLLTITGGSLSSGGSIVAYDDNNLKYERLFKDVVGDINKAMGKEIKILTANAECISNSWDDTTGKLTLVFNGIVKANAGTITITQDESTLLVPAYLTKDEYNSMPGVQSYYEEGTLGADSSFKPDLTTKYILKYEKNTSDPDVVGAYKTAGAHKRSVNILSENVTRTESENKTTFVLDFGALPCKGAKYTFDIPADLVKNDAKKGNGAKSNLVINSSGVEPPVIRIYKPQQEITGCSSTSGGSVDHKLNTKFKIDCRTPKATLKYSYDCLKPKDCKVSVGSGTNVGNGDQRQEEIQANFVYDGTTYTTQKGNPGSGGKPKIVPEKVSEASQSETSYTGVVSIGTNNYKEGLTYKITAKATKDVTVSAYEVAYRTTLVLLNFTNIADVETNRLRLTVTHDGWDYSDNSAVFIRGGDKYEGANTTSGLPSSWDINEKDKTVMMKVDGNDYYFTTWSITVDKFYFQILGGLCDEKTNTSTNKLDTNKNQGPAKSIYLQNQLVHRLPETPIGKGEYIIYNYNGSMFDFDVPGKIMNHR